jgi:hypothetical protein
MNDIDAEKLRPLFEQLAGSINPVSSDAYFEVIQDAGVPYITLDPASVPAAATGGRGGQR